MALSLDKFAAQLAESGVLTEPEVTALRTEHAPADAEQFARLLVKRKVLTAYQAQQAFAGRAKALVLGNYLILDKLGQGGMGMVLKARHRRMDRIVALKVLSPTVVKTPDLLARFHREVKAAARLEHPNIVSAYDADEANGTHFFVMQFVEGTDLSALVKNKGILPVDQAVNCVLQAARGLEYAHKHGVIHRDIKPANLLLDTMGNVKVLDMGLARIEGDTGSQADLTSTGAVMGTVDYMAPEQALDTKSADARSDIYSLGITLWYLLIGRPVYEGNSLMSRLLAHRESPVPSLKGTRGEVPLALDALFQKMLAKQSAQRCQSMTEVVAALEACQRGATAGASSAVPSFSAGPSEDSKLSEMIALFGADTDPAAATRTMVQTGKATVTAKKGRGTAYEATVTSAHPETETDPATLTSLRKTKGSPRKKKPKWWEDRRVLFGGIAASVLLGVIVITITRKDGSTTTVTAPDDVKSVDVKVNGEPVVKVENTPPQPTVTPGGAATTATASIVAQPLKPLYPTSPADLPAGFVRLFNGTDLTGWKGEVLDPKQRAALSPSDLSAAQAKADASMRAHWSVSGGVLSFDGKGDNLCTARDYKDFEFYLEWKITAGGDTGVYLRGAPQVQIWDKDKESNPNRLGSGGLYNNRKHSSRPLVNADKPVGEWNAMLIRMVGEKVTISLNGQLVVDDVVMENHVERDKPIYPTGPIELQKFGSPLQFRNLLIRELNAGGSNDFPGAGSRSAIRFAGVGQFIDHGKVPMRLDQPWTAECWVTPHAVELQSNGDRLLMATIRVSLAERLKAGQPHWCVNVSGGGLYSDKPIAIDHRTHVALVHENNLLSLYVDGQLQGTPKPAQYDSEIAHFSAVPSAYSARPNPTNGGNQNGNGFHGDVDEVRLSQTARYKAAFTPADRFATDDKTLLLYHFEEGKGYTVEDVSGHGHHGTINGAKWVSLPRSANDSIPLFDGRTLAGWRGIESETLPGGWKVEDGAIVASGINLSLVTTADYGDMELDLEWKVAPRANGGVFYGWQGQTTRLGVNGLLTLAPEYQVVDNVGHPDGKKPETSAGSLYNMYAPGTDASRPTGEWNQARIVVRGAVVEHWLNGQRVVTYTVGSEDWKTRAKNGPRGNAFADLQRVGPGKIVLQSNGGIVHYRNLRVRTRPAAGQAATTSRTIDLLPLVNIARDAGVGVWKRVADGIACEKPSGATVIQFPYEPPEEYDFEIEFTTTGSGKNVNQYIVAGSQVFAWKLNSHGIVPPLYGFELLDGKHAKENKEAARQIPEPIRDGRRYRSTVEVRRGSLRSLLDGQVLVEWSGDLKRLTLEESTPMAHLGRPGIGSWQRPVTFHSAKIMEISGPGLRLVMPAGPGASPAPAPSPPDRALDFDGQGDMVRIEKLVVPPASPVTIECRVHPRKLGKIDMGLTLAGRMFLQSAVIPGETHPRWMFAASHEDNTRYLSLVGPPVTEMPSRPVHLAGVYDGNAVRFYIDGKRQSDPLKLAPDYKALPNENLKLGDPWPGAAVLLGAQIGADGPFWVLDGTLDEIRVSDIARYDADFTPAVRFEPDPNTLGLYHCDEPDGDELIDSSGRNRHGTVTGAKRVSATILTASRRSAPGGPGTPEVIDLLAGRPATAGGLTNGAGVDSKGGSPHFFNKVELGESYTLTYDLERAPGSATTDIFLIVGGRSCHLHLHGDGTERLGLHTGLVLVDGQAVHSPKNPTSIDKRFLPFGKPFQLVCQVQPDRVIASVDGKPFLDWQGDPSRLSPQQNLANSIGNVGQRLGFVQFSGMLTCTRATLTRGLAQSLPAASEIIDLLAPTDFAIKNESAFSWRRAGTHLVGTSLGAAGDGEWAGLKFSPPVAGDYDLEIDFKQRGSSFFQIDLPLGDRAARTSLMDHCGYLIWIDGRDWDKLGPPHFLSGKMLREDEPQRFLARVRNQNQGQDVTIEVTLDGQPVASFVGARTRLSIPDRHPHEKHLVQFQAQPLDASRFSMEISRAIVRIAKPLASPAPSP